MVSHTHAVASKGWFIAIVSTNVETDSPEKEIEIGLQGGFRFRLKNMYLSLEV